MEQPVRQDEKEEKPDNGRGKLQKTDLDIGNYQFGIRDDEADADDATDAEWEKTPRKAIFVRGKQY